MTTTKRQPQRNVEGEEAEMVAFCELFLKDTADVRVAAGQSVNFSLFFFSSF